MRMKRMLMVTTQAPPGTPSSPLRKSAEEVEEDQLWRPEAMTRFPLTAFPNLLKYPGGGPGLYAMFFELATKSR